MTGGLAGRLVMPMKATTGELPTGDDWLYELKWDGMRIVAFIDDGRVRLQTTNRLDATASFPELAELARAVPGVRAAILDGEVVALGDDGRPSFGRLQERMHVREPTEARRRAAANPVSYVVFDLLHLDGNDTGALGFRDRRRLLEDLFVPGEHWRLTDLHDGSGAELLDVVTEQGLEGVIAKQAGSRYVEGKRTSAWRKIKPRLRQEFVVGGWAEGKQGRTGSIGSLLVGYFADGGLRHCGSVGSGLDGDAIREWERRVADHACDTSPFDGPVPVTMGRRFHWIDPVFVIEVAFGEWTSDGNLRHPSYLGLRIDKDPYSVVREA